MEILTQILALLSQPFSFSFINGLNICLFNKFGTELPCSNTYSDIESDECAMQFSCRNCMLHSSL